MRFPYLCILLLVCAVGGILPVTADVIPPAYPVQNYSFEIVNTDAYPGYVFVVYPTGSGAGYQVAGKGVTITLPEGLSTRLYAFSADNYGVAAVTAMIRDAASGQGSSSAIPPFTAIDPYQSVPGSVRAAHERFTIVSVNQSTLVMQPVSGRFILVSGDTREVSYNTGEESPGKPHYMGPVLPGLLETGTAAPPIGTGTPVNPPPTQAAPELVPVLAAGAIAAFLLLRRRAG
ncbi:MAG: hypothetical protein LUQ64_03775 [Methanomicrobiales archaeon]|nr:hypothetical protein [Methanomicrobiales archaeon]